jgi:hypothetical protein
VNQVSARRISTVVLGAALLPLLACLGIGGGKEQPAVCADYVACVDLNQPGSASSVDFTYGVDGTCWGENKDARAACEATCATELEACEALAGDDDDDNGDDDDHDDDDDAAATTGRDTAGCPEGFNDAPPRITAASVGCDGRPEVVFAAETDAWVGANNAVFAMETANSFPWSEDHPISPDGRNYGPCGEYDTLEAVLSTRPYGTSDPDTAVYAPGVSSYFTCEAHYDNSVMTYAVSVSDLDGNFSDCFAFGHDPRGLVAGDYDQDFINAPSFDLSACGT